MLGVVLCGGNSTRMNSDKAMLKLDGNTWAEAAVKKLSRLDIPVVLSVNTDQHKQYQQLFSAGQLIIDNDSLNLHGPLLGTISVHLRFPAEDLLLLACDMPAMELKILTRLLSIARQHSSSDAFVFTNDGATEPLCGIYKANGLAHIVELYLDQKLKKHSMKFILDQINSFTSPITNDEKIYFRNINTQSELNEL